MGLSKLIELLSPDESLAFRILALNTEKAHNLRDRSLEVIRMSHALAKRDAKATEQDYAAVREAWRAFRVGGRVDDPALAAAFQARRSALEGADAVPVEAANGAIK